MKQRKIVLTLIVIALLCLPKVNFGQAPNLGTAANFVLFSSVGAVSNTGITHLTGNVGANSGSSTGFGNVDGGMHDGDLVSGQCASDLLIAYGQLNAAVPTFFPAPLLGNGQVLNAGIYSVSGPSVLSLNLTLDGQGDPNALFIIQISGAFSTNAQAKVKLINGALACNVFWKVEGLVSIGTGTSMKGTIIANNAAIVMNVGDTLEGRALSINGAVTVDGILAYTPIGCGSPALTGPGLPTLASTGCFALFSTNGPVSNSGSSFITGDVGTNNGLTTGFNPLFVTGAIHPIPDGATLACATDLGNLYSYLNTLPADIILLYPAQFGHNLVLTPHTYLMNGAVSFTDTLYLNALGDPNAVFVIQVNGAFSTSTYSKVILINGAQSQNVYWKVDGAVNINDYSVFRGTIVGNNGAVNLQTGVTLDGRAFTTTGALSTVAINVIIPPGCGSVFPPIIVTDPINKIGCAVTSISFSVSATGTNLTYQWRKGLVNLVNGGKYSGATSATLTINPISILDNALNYNVVVSEVTFPDVVSNDASLTVNSSPIITTQPTNQITCEGDITNFSVIASGTNLSYQWRKGVVNLIDLGNISGVTTATLNIASTSLGDAALDYNVVVTGTCLPSVTSSNVSLTVNTSPVITTQPTNQISCEGTNSSFSVIASGTNLSYQWRKGLVNLINVGNISGVTSSTLNIASTSIGDAALDYNVVVSGTCLPSITSTNVSLTVNTSPVITTQPINQTVCLGSTVSLTIVATGTNLAYQWRKGLVNLLDGVAISGVNAATLTINPTSALDNGLDYNVVITGICSPAVTSSNTSITINSLPTITTQPVDQVVCSGGSVSLGVFASGTNVAYQWRKGLVNLLNTGIYSGVNTSILTLNPTSSLDAGSDYNVVVSGTCIPSITSNNVAITVDAMPTAVASSNSPVCISSPINLSAQTSVGNYSWSGPNGFVSILQNPVLSSAVLSQSGDYSLVITNGSCTSTISKTTVVVSECGVDLSITKTVDNAVPMIGQNVQFLITVKNEGLYDATNVSVNEVLQSGYTFISSNCSLGTYNYSTSTWTVGNLSIGNSEKMTILAKINRVGDFVNTVTVSSAVVDVNMLNNKAIVETIPTDFFVPEGFSPNDDSINDLFVIRGIKNYPKNEIVIYNRWGEKVYEAAPYENLWDGKTSKGLLIGGNDLPVGTYFYILDLGDGSNVLKGAIYLNR